MITAGWGLHLTIHSIWRLSITFYMFEMEVGTTPCGMRASTTAWLYHLSPGRTFQIGSLMWGGGGNSMMGAPFPHPQHIWRLPLTFLYGWSGWGNYSMWDESLTNTWWYHLSPGSDQWFHVTFQIRSHKCGGNIMMGAPPPHPQHMKNVNNLLHIWHGSVNHSMWDYILNHCNGIIWHPAVINDFSWLSKSSPARWW